MTIHEAISRHVRNSELDSILESVPLASLSDLTRAVTACDSFAELAGMMDGGYTPSLYSHNNRSNSGKVWDAAVEELAGRLKSMGWNVYEGL